MTEVNGLPQELSNLKVGPVKEVLRHGTVVYVALTTGGVVVIDAQNPAAPVVTAHLLEGQKVVQFAHQGPATLIVILEDRGAMSFNVSDPLHPVAPESESRPPRPFGGKGTVLAVKDGAAVLEGGSAAGFYVGEHVRIVSRSHLSPQDQLAEAQGLGAMGTTTAVVALERVEPNRSLARLGRGDEAEPGDEAVGTGDPVSESVVSPRTIPFAWRLNFALRPFLDVGNQDGEVPNRHAVGLLGIATAAYYFAGAPLRIEAGVEPVGLALGAAQHNPLAAIVDLAFASPFFEFGVGTGFSVQATGNSNFLGNTRTAGNEVDPLIIQTLRIGALDGLNFSWRSSIASTSSQGFQFWAGVAELNIPITSRVTLFSDGGGGSGYAYGDFGVRTYLNGLGGPGTYILSLGLGGAAILDNDETLLGPSLMLGLEIRL